MKSNLTSEQEAAIEKLIKSYPNWQQAKRRIYIGHGQCTGSIQIREGRLPSVDVLMLRDETHLNALDTRNLAAHIRRMPEEELIDCVGEYWAFIHELRRAYGLNCSGCPICAPDTHKLGEKSLSQSLNEGIGGNTQRKKGD